MVDEQTKLKFTKFFSAKNKIIDPTLKKIEKWRNIGLVVKHIWLDNAGENRKMKERVESKD